jgi:hypothetical protein
MTRWQSGLTSLNPLAGSWSPPLGSLLPLLSATAAVAVLFLTYWRASRVPLEPPAVLTGKLEERSDVTAVR